VNQYELAPSYVLLFLRIIQTLSVAPTTTNTIAKYTNPFPIIAKIAKSVIWFIITLNPSHAL
jgi:hypothetical protein